MIMRPSIAPGASYFGSPPSRLAIMGRLGRVARRGLSVPSIRATGKGVARQHGRTSPRL